MAELLGEEATRDRLRELLDRVLNLNGLAWGYCPGCRKKVQVEVPDVKKQVDALTTLFDQAFGKPGTTDAEAGGVTIVVQRVWPDASNDHARS